MSEFSWDAKLVLALAAFALNYGEFWLLAQLSTSNQLAKSVAILRHLPSILEHTGPLKPKFDALNNLIRAMMDVTRCVVAFNDLPSNYISHDVPALTTAISHVPTAVYWTIRSVITCVAQSTNLTTMCQEQKRGNTFSSTAETTSNGSENSPTQQNTSPNHLESHSKSPTSAKAASETKSGKQQNQSPPKN